LPILGRDRPALQKNKFAVRSRRKKPNLGPTAALAQRPNYKGEHLPESKKRICTIWPMEKLNTSEKQKAFA